MEKHVYKFKELKDITVEYKTPEKGFVEHKELDHDTETKFIPDYKVIDKEESEE